MRLLTGAIAAFALSTVLTAQGPPNVDWTAVQAESLQHFQALLRLDTTNPPGNESIAANYLKQVLEREGIAVQLFSVDPGRANLVARLKGSGRKRPLLMMGHTDTVRVDPQKWTFPPFAATRDGGYIYGRGAVDMKAMVAMELGVVRLLAAEARAAGLDPARDPIPGLRRDVLFTCTADEEAGGLAGAKWVAENRPEWLRAAGAVNECGGVSTTVAGRRLYPIQVAEKGFAPYRIHITGTWGHGSMPREDNAAVVAAEIVGRLAVPGPIRLTPVAPGVWPVILGGGVTVLGPLFGILLGTVLGPERKTLGTSPIFLFLFLGFLVAGVGLGTALLGVRRIFRSRSTGAD